MQLGTTQTTRAWQQNRQLMGMLVLLLTISLAAYAPYLEHQRSNGRYRTLQYSSARPGRHTFYPTATSINDSTPLSTFLRQRIGRLPPDDFLWVTLLDANYLRQGGTDLTLFLQRLSDGTLPRAPGRVQPSTEISSIDVWSQQINDGDIDFDSEIYGKRRSHQDLLVICLDQACIDLCNERELFGYGGFYQPARQWPDKPPLMVTKLLALKEIAEAGYRSFFVEGDVWLRYDPYPFLPKYSETGFGVSFTYEGSSDVNVGVIISDGSSKAVELFRRAFDELINRVGQWDQGAMNRVLEITYANYTIGAHERKFGTPWGLGVHYLDRIRFVQFHLSYGIPAETALIHTTCVDDYPMRRTLAAAHGFTQDVDGYYSRPRRILSLDALAGDESSIQATLAVAVALAAQTGRDLLLPPTAMYVNASLHPHARNRDIWAVLPFHETEDEFNITVLEPRYLAHRPAHLQRPTRAYEPLTLTMQFYRQYSQILAALDSPVYESTEVVSLNPGGMPVSPFELLSDVPQTYKRLKICYGLWLVPGCEVACLRESVEAREERRVARERGEAWAFSKPVLYPRMAPA
ncbi:uncharacterized protein L969DRAFT_537846 [Mixia osmundae IAM 14324]|uniref:Nucleotide-diphospho-sugar transferase domain-containing protein n=1 Tax=Mixia osmundae (strain CBS 9802 / IAM 14324 / JCM 22182 / KY 12970) TaxID=764103 RepID=G7E7T2_MIXOS|nr:uncharacterized protein L969DRAFT_537846 [Mixia osmundae IAM 14324]KEI38493.1 hypothetical protein L969DRAFT_537846 [Mixia osmundae IAM 14324]GAA98892.1 hypothetical protein E5Q_05580 [Mixia osmundae IAM 14324]